MAKGNYIAYQALRPTESKVGDIFAANIDHMIKAGEAKRAAELQRKLAEGKSLAEIMKGEKIEYKNTITPLNNAVGKMTNEGINALSDAQMSAENINIPIEERMSKVRKAKEFANQVREMQSMASDPSLIDAYKKNQEKIAQGKAFEGDSNIALYTALQTGYIDLRRGENGLEIGYIENINDPEKKVVYKPFQEVKQQYVTPVKDDVVPVYDKWLFDASQRVTTKKTNSNGYVEKSRAFFDTKQAQKLLYDKFGFAEGADVDENYNINAIPDELNQLFYRKEKRNISNKEDFKSALDYSLSIMQGYSDKSTSNKVLQTAADITEQNLRIANAKKRLTEPSGGSGGSSSSPSGFSSVSPSMVTRADKVIVQIPDNTGKVKGNQMWAANTIPLPKVKNYPATDNTFGIAKFKNAKGEDVTNIIMGAPADDGKMVYGKISASDFTNYVSKAGYDPLDVLNKLNEGNNSYNRYTGRVDSSKEIYKKVKIGYKSKEVKNEDDNGW